MPGSPLARQDAKLGDAPTAHTTNSMRGRHHPAALEPRRPAYLELLMSEAKVRVSGGPFDTECHGFSLPPETAPALRTLARRGPPNCDRIRRRDGQPATMPWRPA